MQRPNRPAWSHRVANSVPRCNRNHGANIGATKNPRNNYFSVRVHESTQDNVAHREKDSCLDRSLSLPQRHREHRERHAAVPTHSEILVIEGSSFWGELQLQRQLHTTRWESSVVPQVPAVLCVLCASVASSQIHRTSECRLTRDEVSRRHFQTRRMDCTLPPAK